MTNWQYSESMRRSEHVLEACGVNKALIKGVREGDTVIVCEMERYAMIPLATSACPMRGKGQLLLASNRNDIFPGTIANFSFMVKCKNPSLTDDEAIRIAYTLDIYSRPSTDVGTPVFDVLLLLL